MKFSDLNEALTWLNKHDKPTEMEIDCKIKHKILYVDCSNPNWLEFESDNSLLDWIQEQRDQIEATN